MHIEDTDHNIGLKTTLRTHTCGDLRLKQVGQTVCLCGWVQTTRIYPKFIFVDLRDRYGITQLAVYLEQSDSIYETAKKLSREDVVQVRGTVRERESTNPAIPTGEVEIIPTSLEVMGPSEIPPFRIEDDTDGQEELRLKYRYLDLRRPVMMHNMLLRAKVMQVVRRYLDAFGFLEIETPNLIKATPEGARDFIVPSRLHPGSFYALPQSPQILKQLLMVGGVDRYYQICKCFRDEDFRGDRQPEFTQIDCEMTFVEQEDVLSIFEGMISEVFRVALGIDIPLPIQRMSFEDAMRNYGTDKPDLRFEMPLIELNEAAKETSFPVFQQALAQEQLIVGLRVEGGAGFSRKKIDGYTNFIKSDPWNCRGLVYLQSLEGGGFKSSADKFLTDDQKSRLAQAAGLHPGDMLFLIADTAHRARKAMGALRLEVARNENLIPDDHWSVLYVVDFPLFERDDDTGVLFSTHHPFVMPHTSDLPKLHTEPEQVRALCYDMVINGHELMSGSIRIHRRDIQDQIFGLLGLDQIEVQQKFGFLLEAYRYGAPPHGGCAFGLDRLVMLLAGGQTIRDVMAFPKNSNGRDTMLDAPAAVADDALIELGIHISS